MQIAGYPSSEMLTFSSSRPSLNTDFVPAEVLQQETDEEIVVDQSAMIQQQQQQQRSESSGEVILFHLQEDSDGFYHDEPSKLQM